MYLMTALQKRLETMKVFDSHTHHFPDKVAPKALKALACPSWNVFPFTDGTRAGLIASMSSGGVELSLNLPVTTTPEAVESVNRWAAAGNKPPVLSLGSVHPGYADPAKVLESVRDLGLRGVKMHPEFQAFRPEEERLNPIWRACSELGLIVWFHAGCDINFPRPPRSSPAAFAALHKRFPSLKMVLAHMGGWEMWDETDKELVGAGVMLDTSFTQGLLPPEKLASIIKRHGPDKVLFGTDSPWRDQRQEVEKFMALPLSDDEKKMILYDNAAKLLGL